MPKVVTVAERSTAVSPYRERPLRRTFRPVGPSRGARMIVSLGVSILIGFMNVACPGWHWLLVDSVILMLIVQWARAWRTAGLWQLVAYKYGEPPVDLPELDKPFAALVKDPEWMTKVADTVIATVEQLPERETYKFDNSQVDHQIADMREELRMHRQQFDMLHSKHMELYTQQERLSRAVLHEVADIYDDVLKAPSADALALAALTKKDDDD